MFRWQQEKDMDCEKIPALTIVALVMFRWQQEKDMDCEKIPALTIPNILSELNF